jgi:uncharacterized membrane protein (DUF4010 family)
MGPYAAFNPFRLWLAVILVAGLSLAGHVAARWRGAQQGLLWSGLVGGLASSTAATLALARRARAQPGLARPAAAGIVGSSGVMFVRMAVIAALLQPALLPALALPLLLPAVAAFVATAWLWRDAAGLNAPDGQPDARVFDLPTALAFGLLLGLVALLSRSARDAFGVAGVHAVAFLAGFADVDAPLVSALQMAGQGELASGVAMAAIVSAVAANMVVKAAMAWWVGGRTVGVRVVAGFVFVLLGAALAVAVRAW